MRWTPRDSEPSSEPKPTPPPKSRAKRPADLSALPILRARRTPPPVEPVTEAPPSGTGDRLSSPVNSAERSSTPANLEPQSEPRPTPLAEAEPTPIAESYPHSSALIGGPIVSPEPDAPPAELPSSSSIPEVRVNHKAADRIAAGHPWIFTSDIADRANAQPGQPVKVLDPRGRPLGIAHYSSASQITLRLLSRQVEDIDRDFFLRRLRAAEAHRRTVVTDTDAYRVVHGEADLLPALVVDRYGDYLVMQTLDQGMDAAKTDITSCLEEIFQPKGIVARNDVAVRTKEELPLETTIVSGEIPPSVAVRMNGLTLQADLLHGQKTGIFLDQRENYRAAARYAKGGRALDCFTSTGGFALHLANKFESIEAVDSSGPALDTARANAAANGISNIEWNEADVFDLLSGYSSAHRNFSMVVLDPPAFAKNRQSLEPAVRAYKEINLRALKLLQPGGILVTCSCSHHLSEADLLGVVAQAALDTNRTLRVLERRSQSQDHPILLTVPETLYLKCLILEVV
ncbi:MAG: SAM-dependent methyltransferase [Candidatus Solibacter sp.]|nr:SAM-dependent methyltransferase [Candidatus Solibacter sp.]